MRVFRLAVWTRDVQFMWSLGISYSLWDVTSSFLNFVWYCCGWFCKRTLLFALSLAPRLSASKFEKGRKKGGKEGKKKGRKGEKKKEGGRKGKRRGGGKEEGAREVIKSDPGTISFCIGRRVRYLQVCALWMATWMKWRKHRYLWKKRNKDKQSKHKALREGVLHMDKGWRVGFERPKQMDFC